MKRTAQERAPAPGSTPARQGELEAENALLRQQLAQQADLAEARLRAEISHDLRQPLSALALYASMLKNHVTPAGEPLLAHIKSCLATLSELLAK